MAAGAFFFAAMAALVKVAGARFPTMELVFARSVVVLVLTVAAVRFRGGSLAGRERRLLLLRGVLGFTALSCFYFSVIHLPLAEATVIQYTNPIWTAILAAVLLSEATGRLEILLAVASLGGVLLVAQPAAIFGGGEPLPAGAVGVALAGALFSAGAYVTVRRLRAEPAMTVVFHFALVSVVLSLPAALTGGWVLPVGLEWWLLIGVGLTTHLGQVFLTWGLQREPAGRATMIGYLQIVFAVGWGWFLFRDLPNGPSWTGAAIVLLATGILVRRAPPAVRE
jgi:drug/metabolite transporter (DMT)-like permease